MPKQGDMFMGIFADYEGSGEGVAYPSDEQAISEAADEMFSMCGNAGQEALIGNNIDVFEEWAMGLLEEQGFPYNTWDAFQEYMTVNAFDGDLQKWEGTDIIWGHGYTRIAAQSGYHDSYDEYGEGTGLEV